MRTIATDRSPGAGALLAALLLLPAWQQAAAQQSAPPAAPPAATIVAPPTFTAKYAVAWHGITAGTSTLALTRTAPGQYRYTSTDNAHGLFRLVFPDAIQQESRFELVAGQIRPSSFRAEGGGPPEDVQFDWARGRVSGTAKGKHIDLALQPGTQDPGSVQIALMLALLAGHAPDHFWMLNTDEVDDFHYVKQGAATLDTPLGPLHTILYTSHHPGSDRTMYLWLAPSLDYLPARAEQHRGHSTLISLNILAFKRT